MRKKSFKGWCYYKSKIQWQEWYGNKKMKTLVIPHITNRKFKNEFDKNMKSRFIKVKITIEVLK